MFKKLLIPLLTSCAIQGAYAVDLGVKGEAYPITEIDIRQQIMEDMKKVNFGEIQDNIKKGAQSYLSSLPKRNYLTPDETFITWMDPSTELAEDINGPVQQPDGTYQWGVLFPKGTKVNPLEQVRPVDVLVFFDGADEAQVSLVEKLHKHAPISFTLIEAGKGDLPTSNKRFKQGIFHAPDIMLEKFKVQYLPTLVYAGEGDKSLYLANMAVSPTVDPKKIVMALPKFLNIPPMTDKPETKTSKASKANATVNKRTP